MLKRQLFATTTAITTVEGCNMSELCVRFVALLLHEAKKSVKEILKNKFVGNAGIKGKWIMF